MRVVVVANVEQQAEIESKNTNAGVELVFMNSLTTHDTMDNYDAAFYLREEAIDAENFGEKPVFINSVIDTLKQKKLPANFSRVNGWPGFLVRDVWEIASFDKIKVAAILEAIGWKAVFVKDEAGLVAARVISMIINEAFFALEEGVSTADEIDIAMKLGTGYPYGPFEWLHKIGVQNIYHLLKSLSVTGKRYTVASLLEKKYFETASY